MIVRALDVNGDWTFGGGKSNYLSGNNATAQCIKTRLLMFLADCFFDLEAGIDWFNLLGGKNQLAIEFNLKSVILNSPNVIGVTQTGSILTTSNRLLSPSYLVDTVFTGEQISTVELFNGNLLDELGDILTTEDGLEIGI